MKEKKISYLNLMIIFFLSYSFYTIQILTQQLFSNYGKESVIIICISQLLLPLTTYITCKIINNNSLKQGNKNKFLFTIFTSFYLIITCIISITNITNIITLYYYQNTNYILLLIVISLPIIYTLIKGDHILFYLGSILLIIYTIFKYSYLGNNSNIDFYVFSNVFKIAPNNILPLIIYCLPIFLEPLILLNNQNLLSTKVNTKTITIFSIIISLIGVLTILRQTWEFGNLLDKIRFPYLESIKNIIAGKFFENIDFYYLLSISVSVYVRLGYTLITIKNSFKLKNIITIFLLISILTLIFIIQRSMSLYLFSINKILTITSSCLLICLLLLPFIIKRRKNTNA